MLDLSAVWTSREASCSYSCVIKADGCVSPYVVSNLSATGTTFFGNNNILDGWTETVCLECTGNNDGQILQKDSMIFSQTAQCYDKIQKIGNQEKQVKFDGEREIQPIDGLFKNLDEQNCKMKCYLKNKGCQDEYDGSSLILFNSIISFATTEKEEGQVSDVCVQCSNGASTEEIEIQLV